MQATLDDSFLSDLRSASTKALRALTSVLDAALDPSAERRPQANQIRLAAIQVLKLAQTFLIPVPASATAKPFSSPIPAASTTSPLAPRLDIPAPLAAPFEPIPALHPVTKLGLRRPSAPTRLLTLAGACPVPS